MAKTSSSTQDEIQNVAMTPVFVDQVWVDFWPYWTDTPNADLYTAGGNEKPRQTRTLLHSAPRRPKPLLSPEEL